VGKLKILAIICAYNEGDIIYHIIRQLTEQGIDVYLMDNCSTDNTVDEARKLLGKGLVQIESFPQDAGYAERNTARFVLGEQLNRKEEIARGFEEYDWFIHSDADEIREGPWPDKSLYESIEFVDRLGYNAINHEVFRFVPIDDSFLPGDNVREQILHFESCEWYWSPQVKSWKRTSHRLNLAQSGGHIVSFPGLNIFPIRFLLLHYPIRGLTHGRKKIFQERLDRYAEDELKRGWHRQYAGFRDGNRKYLSDVTSSSVRRFDLRNEQLKLLSRFATELITVAALADFNFCELEIERNNIPGWLNRCRGEGNDLNENELNQCHQRFDDALALFLQDKFDASQLDDVERLNYLDILKVALYKASVTNRVDLGKKLGRFKRLLE
jgi:glycosyltransferase involved in cell wall biosynthesis